MRNSICRIFSPELFALSRQKNASLEKVTTVRRNISWTFSSKTILIWMTTAPGGLFGSRWTTSSISNKWLVRLYTYGNRQQRDYIKELWTQSMEKTFMVAQIDLSMNYIFLRQREVQQGFFSQHQAILFTIHPTIGQEHRKLAIMSDCMEHTTSFVYCAQRILVKLIEKNFSMVQKIDYLRGVSSLLHARSSFGTICWSIFFLFVAMVPALI